MSLSDEINQPENTTYQCFEVGMNYIFEEELSASLTTTWEEVIVEESVRDNSEASTQELAQTTSSNNGSTTKDVYAQEELFAQYFEIIQKLDSTDYHKQRGGVLAKCRFCTTKLQGSFQVTSNFVRHLRIKHPQQLAEYEQFKSYSSRKRQYSDTIFQNLTVKVIANNMLPISIVEDKTFRQFVTFLNPQAKLMTRTTGTKRIDDCYKSMI
ncbi:PREDICTED: uncharacterized protein LOC108362911, partial [Rhagoletis zephyria]|uniref:uncharacterized protein LOC108362911 n=1 Tax=Rhagoletis zephyria TaxID=28612 RepID=UPI0008114E7E